MKGSLVIHAGGFEATREEVLAVAVPEEKLSYREFLDSIDSAMGGAKLPVRWDLARFALAREGQQLFGVAPLDLSLSPDYAPQVGFRQSYDSSLSAGLTLGSRVFVCDNLAFNGEFHIQAKNTKNIAETIAERLKEAAGRILGWAQGMDGEIGLMRKIRPSKWEVAAILIELVQSGAVPGSKLAAILKEIEHPTYNYEGDEGSLWHVFNAVTMAQRDRSPVQQFKTGGPILGQFRLHGLKERRVELTREQREALEDMERETAKVYAEFEEVA